MVKDHAGFDESDRSCARGPKRPLRKKSVDSSTGRSQWWELHKKQLLCGARKQRRRTRSERFRRGTTRSRRSSDSRNRRQGASADGTALSPAARLAWSDNDADAVINATKDRAARQKKLAGFDKRIDDEKELDGLYDKWIGLVVSAATQRAESLAARESRSFSASCCWDCFLTSGSRVCWRGRNWTDDKSRPCAV